MKGGGLVESGRRNGWKSHSTGGIDGFPMDLELVGVFFWQDFRWKKAKCFAELDEQQARNKNCMNKHVHDRIVILCVI